MESGNKQNFPKYNPEVDNNKSNSLVSWNKYIKTTLEIKISKIIKYSFFPSKIPKLSNILFSPEIIKYSKWEFSLIISIIIFRKFTKWANQNESKLVHYIRKFTL